MAISRRFLAETRVVGARRLFPRRVLGADAEVRRGRKRRGDRAQPDRAQPARDGPREPTETATPSLFFLYRRRFRETTSAARRAHPDLVARRRPDLLSIPDRAGAQPAWTMMASASSSESSPKSSSAASSASPAGFSAPSAAWHARDRARPTPRASPWPRRPRPGTIGRAHRRWRAGTCPPRVPRARDPAWFLPRAESAVHRGHRAWHVRSIPLDADDGSALTDRRACVVPHTFSRVSARTF